VKQAENSTAITNWKELNSRNETIGKGNRKSKSTLSQRRRKQVLKKKKLYGKEWNDEGKLCLYIPSPCAKFSHLDFSRRSDTRRNTCPDAR
jgi:hypothetical protein